MTILVVDDKEVNRRLCVQILAPEGHEIDQAANGQEAVDMCSKKDYDFIIMDICMPIMNGVQAAIEIKKIDPSPKILFVTAYKEAATLDLSVGEGLIIKPIDAQTLRRKVAHANA